MSKAYFNQQQKQEIKKIVKEALVAHLGSLEPKMRLEGASLYAASELIGMVYDDKVKDSTKLKAIEIVLEAAGVIERRGRRKFSRKASQTQSHIPVSVNIDQAAKAYLSTL